jgi:hypothetical protein
MDYKRYFVFVSPTSLLHYNGYTKILWVMKIVKITSF